ncbi:MAG: DUF997 family protein [Planctomycetes bacterium]|nr:DUF997 family protein [Planctomycetota bacterium]
METPASRLLRNARREAWIVLAVWAACILWTVTFCWLRGYRDAPVSRGEALPATVLGIPDWVVYGIGLPWVLATAFTIAFALFGIADDDLGEDVEGERPGEAAGGEPGAAAGAAPRPAGEER